MNQQLLIWKFIISMKFKDPDTKTTGKRTKPIEISYEIIWATALNAPKNAYFELLAHPAKIIPYTDTLEIAKKNNILKSMSAKINTWLNGINTQLNNDKTIVMYGAIKNKKTLDWLGIVASFTINFTPSAIGCKSPKPVTFGPLRRWIVPITFRSASVKNAIAKRTGTIKTKNDINEIINDI